MYKSDTLNRYQLFLNEVIELASAGQLKSLSGIRAKYGVSGALVGFVKDKKIVINVGNHPKIPEYKALRKNPFSAIETQMFIADFNRWKRKRFTTVVESSGKTAIVRKTPKKGSCLADVTTRELVAELKRRGYSGTIHIQKDIEF